MNEQQTDDQNDVKYKVEVTLTKNTVAVLSIIIIVEGLITAIVTAAIRMVAFSDVHRYSPKISRSRIVYF